MRIFVVAKTPPARCRIDGHRGETLTAGTIPVHAVMGRHLAARRDLFIARYDLFVLCPSVEPHQANFPGDLKVLFYLEGF